MNNLFRPGQGPIRWYTGFDRKIGPLILDRCNTHPNQLYITAEQAEPWLDVQQIRQLSLLLADLADQIECSQVVDE